MITYNAQIGKREKKILDEIAFYTDINIRKRKFVTCISYFGAVLMIIYSILSFSVKHYVATAIGILITIFFLWIAIDKAKTLQKKITNFVNSKFKNKSVDQNIQYYFCEEGIKINSDLGNATNYWKAFKCWGMYQRYLYIRTSTNQMILVNPDKLSKIDVDELMHLLHKHLQKETLF